MEEHAPDPDGFASSSAQEPVEPETTLCRACGLALAKEELACPSCHQLVHSDRLKELAASAESAAASGDLSHAMAHWRAALELLPHASKQYEVIVKRMDKLRGELDRRPTGAASTDARPSGRSDPPSWVKRAGPLGVLAMLVWKLKLVVAFVLSQGKLLVLGLTKGTTLLSMLLYFGVYWRTYGWVFALGLVASIYVHEMGHIAALRRYGIAATAPMFIPGLGALVRLKQHPIDPIEDARVGLAGPLWGLGAAALAYVLSLIFESGPLAAIAHSAAWLNLFNLVPVWQLDGSRGFASLTKRDRGFAVAAISLAWFLSRESLLLIILIAAIIRAFSPKVPNRRDPVALGQYVFLVASLTMLATISAP
jgi:Zn-dependent protease